MKHTRIGSLDNEEGSGCNGTDEYFKIESTDGNILTEERIRTYCGLRWEHDCVNPGGYFCKDFTIMLLPYYKYEAVVIVKHRYDI